MDPLSNFGVSVLVPVYFSDSSVQKVRWLRRALESVRDQEFPDGFEIVIVDDGSPTPVAEHALELGSVAGEVRWLRAARNGGIVSALNLGLRAAQHPLIARLDADDAWCATKMQKQLALLAADPDLTITATGMTRVDESDSVIDHHVRPGDWNGILRFFVEVGCPFPHGSVVARKDVYGLFGGYPHDSTFAHCEDFALWGTWLRFFKPAMVEESLYRYTVASSSVSVVHGERQAGASRIVHERFRNLDLPERLPSALSDLGRVLGISTSDAGQLAFTMWRFGACFMLPEEALAPLRIILADRDVHAVRTAPNARTLRSAFPRAGEVTDRERVATVATSNG